MTGPAARLTITIPYYRGAAYLRRAIDSVLAQSCADWLLVVSDDRGPEPGIEALVRSYRDPRIAFAQNERNLGLAGNWNRCLELATTDLVTIFHADDELLPNYVRLVVDLADRHPASAALFCGARIIDAGGRPAFSFPDYVKGRINPLRGQEADFYGDDSLANLLRGNFIMCPTLAYRKSKIGTRRFRTDRKMVPDLDFTSGLLLDGLILTGTDRIAYSYRRHDANATSEYTRSLLRFTEEVALYDELAAKAAARQWRSAAVMARRKTIIKLNLAYCIAKNLLSLRLGQALQKARFLAAVCRPAG